MTVPVAVAVDVGGTSIKGALVDRAGQVRHVIDRPTPKKAPESLETVLDVIDELWGSAGDPVAVGVVVPGAVRDGVVTSAENLGWVDVPLHRMLTRRTAVPVVVAHDVRAVAAAEWHARAGRSDRLGESVLAVSLGTGIGAGYAAGGSSLDGARGAAGELGHVVVRPGGELCACGGRGCVERYASASAVLRRYRAGGGKAESAADVVSRVGVDPLATLVWGEAIEALADALATAVALLDPEVIVLAGGLSRAGSMLTVPLAEALVGSLPWRPAPALELTLLGSDAGRRAAGHLAFEGIE